MNKYYVYKITNTVNGMFYIGKTYNIEKRFSEHIENSKLKTSQTNLSKGIRKYGAESFKIEKLLELPTDEDALIMEARIVLETGATDRFTGYNHPNPKHGTPYKIMAAKRLSTENSEKPGYVVKENGMRKEVKNGKMIIIGRQLFCIESDKMFFVDFDFVGERNRIFQKDVYPVFGQLDKVVYTYMDNLMNFDFELQYWKDKRSPMRAEIEKLWKIRLSPFEIKLTDTFFEKQKEIHDACMNIPKSWTLDSGSFNDETSFLVNV